MKKNNLPSWQSGAAVGTLSTVLIAIIQGKVISLSLDEIQLYTTLAPVISTILVTVVNYVAAVIGVKSTSVIRAEKNVIKRISSLEKQIKKSNEIGACTNALLVKYNHAVLAKDKLYEDMNKAILNGD